MKLSANSNVKSLMSVISSVRNFRHKATWIMEIAKTLKVCKNILVSMTELRGRLGVGQKSANTVMLEVGTKAEGIMVDLHVVRVAPRLGIVTETDPKKIELQLMDILPQKVWADIRMAMSFLGRETCRPSNPKHEECVMHTICAYCKINKVSMLTKVSKPDNLNRVSKTLQTKTLKSDNKNVDKTLKKIVKKNVK